MSLEKLLTFAFASSEADFIPGSANSALVDRLFGILGKDEDERAYLACRFIKEMSQFIDNYEFPKVLFDDGTKIEVVKSHSYSQIMIDEGDYHLLKDSMSFALTSYSAGVASACEEDLGRAYSRRARALFLSQRFEDCAVDIGQAIKHRIGLSDIEICFLGSMKKYCYHVMGQEDPFASIGDTQQMKKWLGLAETPTQIVARLVQAVELLTSASKTTPSNMFNLSADLAHPSLCWIIPKKEESRRLSLLPPRMCRIPTHMPNLHVEPEPRAFTEYQWLMKDVKRRKQPKKAPALKTTNKTNSCFSGAIRFTFNGTKEVAMASRDILAGDLVAVERPWASVVNPVEHCTFCDNCKERCLTLIPCWHCSLAMYCGKPCRTVAWFDHHSDECAILRALHKSVHDWQQLEVATLALRMFFTCWRESNRSIDFMRFRFASKATWPIGLPSKQAKLQTSKIHFEPVQTTPPFKTNSLKASLAAACLTQLLGQHTKVLKDPEGPECSVSSPSQAARKCTTLRHSIQPSFSNSEDKKKSDFWVRILEEDPDLFYGSGLSDALDLATPVSQETSEIKYEVMESFSKSVFTYGHLEENERSGEGNAKNYVSEDEKKLEHNIPATVKSNAEGMKSSQGASRIRRDKTKRVAKTGEVAEQSKGLAAGNDARVPSLNDTTPRQAKEGMASHNVVRKEVTIEFLEDMRRIICDWDRENKPKGNSADKTPCPGVDLSEVNNVCARKEVLPSVSEDRKAVSKERCEMDKAQEISTINELEVYEIILKKIAFGNTSGQDAGCSNTGRVAAGHANKMDENGLPMTDDEARDKTHKNKSDHYCFEASCIFDNVIVVVKLVGLGDEVPRKETKRVFIDLQPEFASQDHATADSSVIHSKGINFPRYRIEIMKKCVGYALRLMQPMNLPNQVPANMTEESAIRIFLGHLRTLMNKYSIHEQEQASCSTVPNFLDMSSVESDNESFTTAVSNPQGQTTGSLWLFGQIKAYNHLKNLVDLQTADQRLASLWRNYNLADDADKDSGSGRYVSPTPPIPTQAGPFDLIIEPTVSTINDSLTSGFVRFEPLPKASTPQKLKLQDQDMKLTPEEMSFSIGFYDDWKPPLSVLVDVNIVPSVYVDRKVFSARPPHLTRSSLSLSMSRKGPVACMIALLRYAGFTRRIIFKERVATAKRKRVVRHMELLAYPVAQAAKFATAQPLAQPALWDDLPVAEANLGLFYTRNDGPVAAIDDFMDVYFKECFRSLGPRTHLPSVHTNFMYVPPKSRPMAAYVENNFFHHLPLTNEAVPRFARRQRRLKPDDVYFDPTSMFKRALLPWYYDFFHLIYERRLRAVNCLMRQSPGDNIGFLKGKATKEMMEFRQRLMMPRPLLGRPDTVRETYTAPPLSPKMEERIAFVTRMMLSYYHLASKATLITECTYSVDETGIEDNRPPRPACHIDESFMNPELTLAPGKLEYSTVGLDSYRPFGAAVYSTPSYLPHSCDPNVFSFTASGDVGVWAAIRHIRKGETLTVSYGPLSCAMKHYDRKAVLRHTFGLECVCDACAERIEPEDFLVSKPELICVYCTTQLTVKISGCSCGHHFDSGNDSDANGPHRRSLICPKCKKRNDANRSLRRLTMIRRYIDHARVSLYGRPAECYNFLPKLAEESAFVYDHVQRPYQLTFALEEVIKMALIQKIGNFNCIE